MHFHLPGKTTANNLNCCYKVFLTNISLRMGTMFDGESTSGRM